MAKAQDAADDFRFDDDDTALAGAAADSAASQAAAGGQQQAQQTQQAEPPVEPDGQQAFAAAAEANSQQAQAQAAAGDDQQYTIRDMLREAGFAQAAELGDDLEAFNAFLSHNRHVEQQVQAANVRMAQLQQQFQIQQAQLVQQLQAFQQGQQGQQGGQQGQAARSAAAAQARSAIDWKAPEWNPAWQNQIVMDEHGNPTLAVGADPTILPKYHAWREHAAKYGHEMLAQPAQFFGQFGFVTQDQVQQQVASLLQQELQRREVAQELDRIWGENAEWMVQHDARGVPMRDPYTGQPQLTPEGLQATQHFHTLAATGMHPRQAFMYAVAPVRESLLQQMTELQSRQGNVDQTQQQTNRDFVRAGAARRPNRGGARQAVQHNHKPAPSNQDFFALAQANFQDAGLLGGGN